MTVNLRSRRAQEIAHGCNLSPKGRQLLTPELTPRQFFDRLVEAESYQDGLRFLAHALPKRTAIWWGCMCVWQGYRPHPSEVEDAALQAAVAWILNPSEENRRTAEKAGRAAKLTSPAGCLAMAAFWSEGSMSRPNLPPRLPPPLLTARTVAGAVLLASARAGKHPERRLRRREFLAMGIDVAQGRCLWYAPEPAAAEEIDDYPQDVTEVEEAAQVVGA